METQLGKKPIRLDWETTVKWLLFMLANTLKNVTNINAKSS